MLSSGRVASPLRAASSVTGRTCNKPCQFLDSYHKFKQSVSCIYHCDTISLRKERADHSSHSVALLGCFGNACEGQPRGHEHGSQVAILTKYYNMGVQTCAKNWCCLIRVDQLKQPCWVTSLRTLAAAQQLFSAAVAGIVTAR